MEGETIYRQELYEYMKTTLSPNLTDGDLDIIIKLMCYIFGDLTETTVNVKNQIDPDKADDNSLRHLASVIGYQWNEALTADQQRESIKLFIDIRKQRGTVWSLENLIRVFGQDTTSFYSSSNLKGVRIIEYTPDSIPDDKGMYPGDLIIEVPQFSTILRHAIDNIRLIGTRIMFAYMIYVGVMKAETTFDTFKNIQRYFDPADWGLDPMIMNFGPNGLDTVLGDIEDWFLSDRIRGCQTNFNCAIYLTKLQPFERGFIWNSLEKEHYRGFLINEEVLKDADVMYD